MTDVKVQPCIKLASRVLDNAFNPVVNCVMFVHFQQCHWSPGGSMGDIPGRGSNTEAGYPGLDLGLRRGGDHRRIVVARTTCHRDRWFKSHTNHTFQVMMMFIPMFLVLVLIFVLILVLSYEQILRDFNF